MPLYIEPEDQKKVDELRITLAQITVDLTEVKINDTESQRVKTCVFQQLSQMRTQMDDLGIMHSQQKYVQRQRAQVERSVQG